MAMSMTTTNTSYNNINPQHNNNNNNQIMNSSPDESSILSSDSSKPSHISSNHEFPTTHSTFSSLSNIPQQQTIQKFTTPNTYQHINHNHNHNQHQNMNQINNHHPFTSYSSNIQSHQNQSTYPQHQNNSNNCNPSMLPSQSLNSNHTLSTDSPHSQQAPTPNTNNTEPVECDVDPLPVGYHDNNLSLADMSLSSLYGKNLEFDDNDKNMMNPFQSPRDFSSTRNLQNDCNLNPFGTNTSNTNTYMVHVNNNPFGIDRTQNNPCFYQQFPANPAFNQGIGGEVNNNGMIQGPPQTFQAPVPPPIFNNNPFTTTSDPYTQQQPDPSIVSFAPGRPRPGASSQIYGHTICNPANKMQDNPPTDTILTNSTNNNCSQSTNCCDYNTNNNTQFCGTNNNGACTVNNNNNNNGNRSAEYVYNSNGDVIGILDSSMSVVTSNGQYNMMRPLALPPIDNIQTTPTTLSTPSCGNNDITVSPNNINNNNNLPPSINDNCNFTVTDVTSIGHPANNTHSIAVPLKQTKQETMTMTHTESDEQNNHKARNKHHKPVKTITRSTMKRGRHISNAEKPFICETCGKGYKYLCNYRSHCKIHTDDAFVCKFCNKRFGRKSNYKEHIRIHTGEAPYKCQFCDRTFKQHHGWKDHLRVHTGEKPYLCKVCGKRFTVGHNLNVHMRIHTGERPYTCNICKKSYRQKSAYNSHIKNVHGIKVQRKAKGSTRDKKMQIQRN